VLYRGIAAPALSTSAFQLARISSRSRNASLRERPAAMFDLVRGDSRGQEAAPVIPISNGARNPQVVAQLAVAACRQASSRYWLQVFDLMRTYAPGKPGRFFCAESTVTTA